MVATLRLRRRRQGGTDALAELTGREGSGSALYFHSHSDQSAAPIRPASRPITVHFSSRRFFRDASDPSKILRILEVMVIE